jgi:hypothetical protein
MNTKEVIDRIFKEPGVQFELTEFENLGKPIHEILSVYPKAATTGKDAGKTKYYLKSLIPFSTGNEEVQVYAEGGKSAPEEIVRQLWVYKLMHQYGYQADEIDLEKRRPVWHRNRHQGGRHHRLYRCDQAHAEDHRRVQETQAQGRHRAAQELHERQGRAGRGVVQRGRQHHPVSALPGAVRRHAVRHPEARAGAQRRARSQQDPAATQEGLQLQEDHPGPGRTGPGRQRQGRVQRNLQADLRQDLGREGGAGASGKQGGRVPQGH